MGKMEAVKKKMRTLKGKLDEAEAACKKAEEQLQCLNDQAADVEGQVECATEEIRGLEDELDSVESRNMELAEKLIQAHKGLDENGQAKKIIDFLSKLRTVISKISFHLDLFVLTGM